MSAFIPRSSPPNALRTRIQASCVRVPLAECVRGRLASMCVHARLCVCVSITFHLIVSSKLLFPPSVQMEAVTRTVSCPPTVRQVRDTWKPTVSSTRSLSNLQPAYLLVKPLNKLQAPRQMPTRADTLVSVVLWRL